MTPRRGFELAISKYRMKWPESYTQAYQILLSPKHTKYYFLPISFTFYGALEINTYKGS